MDRPRRSRAGGCDFAVDPALPAAETRPIWLPRVNPRLAVLTRFSPELFGGPKPLADAWQHTAGAAEGLYVELNALTPATQALLLAGNAGVAIGLVLPLDSLVEDRIDAARRLYRLLTRGKAEPSRLTDYRRERLRLALRAVDAKQSGAGYRETAKGLFPRLLGRDRQPSEALVGRTIRLVRYGLRLISGDYLELLRPERRRPRARRG